MIMFFKTFSLILYKTLNGSIMFDDFHSYQDYAFQGMHHLVEECAGCSSTNENTSFLVARIFWENTFLMLVGEHGITANISSEYFFHETNKLFLQVTTQENWKG